MRLIGLALYGIRLPLRGGFILLIINFHAVRLFFVLAYFVITGTFISCRNKMGVVRREWISASFEFDVHDGFYCFQ